MAVDVVGYQLGDALSIATAFSLVVESSHLVRALLNTVAAIT
jgi:hypothetical protein